MSSQKTSDNQTSESTLFKHYSEELRYLGNLMYLKLGFMITIVGGWILVVKDAATFNIPFLSFTIGGLLFLMNLIMAKGHRISVGITKIMRKINSNYKNYGNEDIKNVRGLGSFLVYLISSFISVYVFCYKWIFEKSLTLGVYIIISTFVFVFIYYICADGYIIRFPGEDGMKWYEFKEIQIFILCLLGVLYMLLLKNSMFAILR